jgi:hypothetical protein
MAKKVKVIITITGEIKIEAQGFKGSTCKEATKFLESLGEVKNFDKKAEYYQSPGNDVYVYITEK